jgi:hypothetical protein
VGRAVRQATRTLHGSQGSLESLEVYLHARGGRLGYTRREGGGRGWGGRGRACGGECAVRRRFESLEVYLHSRGGRARCMKRGKAGKKRGEQVGGERAVCQATRALNGPQSSLQVRQIHVHTRGGLCGEEGEGLYERLSRWGSKGRAAGEMSG